MIYSKVLYIAGRYSGRTPADVQDHIQQARRVAIRVWEIGHVALCPHLNTAHFEKDCQATYEQYIAGDLLLLAKCDAVVMVPGWESSRGATQERVFALERGLPVYYFPDLPALVSP